MIDFSMCEEIWLGFFSKSKVQEVLKIQQLSQNSYSYILYNTSVKRRKCNFDF